MFKRPPFLLFLLGLVVGLTLGVKIVPGLGSAGSVIPGWHTTVFPSYYVPGLVLSGLAFFQLLLVGVRQVFQFQAHIKIDHIEGVNKLILGASLLVLIRYGFSAWNSNFFEQFAFNQRVWGQFWSIYFGLMCLSAAAPQAFWWRRIRRNMGWTAGICLLPGIGDFHEWLIGIVMSMAKLVPGF